jgi:hypothetical protein
MAISNSGLLEQVYNVREDDTLSARVALVICVLVERGAFVAGYTIGKELLTIHYTAYGANKPVWELDFFEHLFASEPLLAVRDKVKGVITGTGKNLIVPDELYDEQEAEKWLRKLHFVEQLDRVNTYPLDNDKAILLQAMPVNIAELVKINFKKAMVLPLHAYQFEGENAQSLHMQLCLAGDQVFVTLHNYSQLLWNHVVSYACAEDIAFAIKQMCKENYIDPVKLHISCNALAGTDYDVINSLTQYFPNVRSGNGEVINARWQPAICLANQLLACVL